MLGGREVNWLAAAGAMAKPPTEALRKRRRVEVDGIMVDRCLRDHNDSTDEGAMLASIRFCRRIVLPAKDHVGVVARGDRVTRRQAVSFGRSGVQLNAQAGSFG